MQPPRDYDNVDFPNHYKVNLGSESQESSVQGPELTLELETIRNVESSSEKETKSSELESEEGDIESELPREDSDEDAGTYSSSIASSQKSSKGYDECGEGEASFYTSGREYNEDSDLDSAKDQESVEPKSENSPLGTPLLDQSSPKDYFDSAFDDLEPDANEFARILGSELENVSYNRTTISDDRSADSKIEERNLLALRERANWGVRVLVPLIQTQSAYMKEQRDLQAQWNKQEKYQRMAQQKQDLGTPAAGFAAAGFATMGIEVEVSPSGEISTTEKPNRIDDQTIKTNLQHVLDGSDPSQLDLQKLQEYIELLQVKAQQYETMQKEQAPSKRQIIYRIKQKEIVHQRKGIATAEDRFMPFFDHPKWVKGQGVARGIQCNLPLNNFDLYLEKNKDVAFIVYRNFDTDSARIVAKPGTDDVTSGRAAHLPQHTSETIRPVSGDLIEAVKTLLNSRQEYADLLRDFSVSYELPAPYLFIYHSRKSLEEFQDSLPLPAHAQLSLLSKYVTEEYADEYAAADSLLSRGRTSPEYVHYLFKPGDLLVSSIDGQYMGYVSTSWPEISRDKKVSRMRARTSGNGSGFPLYGSQDGEARMASDEVTVHVCDVRAWHWAFDGSFQRQHKTLHLELPAAKDGDNATDIKGKNSDASQGQELKTGLREKSISDLNVFPMQFASAEIVDKCRRRGKTFWKCRTRKFVSYQDSETESIQNLVDERYMIDLKTYRSLHPKSKSGSSQLTDELGTEAMARDEPPDEQFELLLPLTIKGYNLRRKKWFDLAADRIAEVTWNKEAFQNLVIDHKVRDLIRALVSNQLAAEKGTDLIMGKGNGLILLLHGGPGTDKTLTAESVAEIAEKPLYRVTCGDVGTKVEDVEKYLESVLHLGKIWDCVVLLDEADVFLEQRSLEDMERNALVSVFLRVLEYYEGILVLTSNRVGTFDEAFKSRIQLALHYPVLGPYQRLRIWENFLNRLESFGNDDKVDIAGLRDNLEDLKEEKMNGRQIRNAITTARQYVEWKGSTLTYEHLKDVIQISGRFDQYLDQLNGGFTQGQLAEDEGLRLAEDEGLRLA